ncbi:DUF2523 family protein [Pseudoalteromonas sp.]|uniref:DUF2523 family protein n=1 Tax=Pseudoalteromonas sp. TaxID=53249 RepID=UPI003562A3D1
MPILIQAFFTALAALLPHLVIQVLFSAGFGVVVYNLGSFTIDYAFQQMGAYVGAMPAEFIGVLSLAQFDVAVSIIFGTYAAVFTLLGIRSGSKQSLKFKGLPQ